MEKISGPRSSAKAFKSSSSYSSERKLRYSMVTWGFCVWYWLINSCILELSSKTDQYLMVIGSGRPSLIAFLGKAPHLAPVETRKTKIRADSKSFCLGFKFNIDLLFKSKKLEVKKPFVIQSGAWNL